MCKAKELKLSSTNTTVVWKNMSKMILSASLLLVFSLGAVLGNCIDGHNRGSGPLDLTSLIESGQVNKARSLSTVDPTLFADVQSHAAYITVNKTNKWHTFFWFFPVVNQPLESTPWVIWLQGGPGGSSLYGLFKEIGPLQFINGTVQKMPVTWGSNYSLLFIDNPIGAGFSYSEDETHFVKNDEEVGVCLLNFIQQFLQVFPELQKAPLFIAGESYAGKYVPSFGYHIHHYRNKSIPINLKGLAIGDGFIDPPTLYHFSELGLQFGIYDWEQAAAIKKLEDVTRKAWNEGKIDEYKKLARATFFTALQNLTNIYSIIKDDGDNFDFPFSHFLNRTHVKSALHVGNRPFIAINNVVNLNFQDVFFLPSRHWLEDLLEQGYGVMGYNGQLDFSVGYALSEHTYRALNWSGAKAYRQAQRQEIHSWNPGHSLNPIGYVKAAGNFMDVMIRAAGHMVPADQPYAAKQMIDMFIDKFK